MRELKGTNMARFYEFRGWPVTPAGGIYWAPSGTGARWLMNVPDHALPHPQPGEL